LVCLFLKSVEPKLDYEQIKEKRDLQDISRVNIFRVNIRKFFLLVAKQFQKLFNFSFFFHFETFFSSLILIKELLILLFLRVHHKLGRIVIRKAVSPDVKGRPVAEVEEDEQEGKDDQKDQVRPAVVVRRRLPTRAVSAGRVLVVAALELHLARVALPVAVPDFRFC